MGAAACAADLAVVTSDNPRSENPEQIINAILDGMGEARTPPHRECDRRRAIRWAIAAASSGDAVLIAGKGHETEQIIGRRRIPFDDCAVVRECLTSLPSPSHSSQTVAAPS
jgi:UDP-N-acetylmuramoyl-L-alanyl-D-glutamate--2,6-diaminopimelate ligase